MVRLIKELREKVEVCHQAFRYAVRSLPSWSDGWAWTVQQHWEQIVLAAVVLVLMLLVVVTSRVVGGEGWC